MSARDLDRVRRLAARRVAVERDLDAAIMTARDAGATWAQIGAALGTTWQNAAKRHTAARKRASRAAT